jgi:ATP-binding cassette subfamily B protein
VSEHYDQFEEEEFDTQFNGQTVRRLIGQMKPYWPQAVGFIALVAFVSFLDSYFTFLSKRIIDEGIVAQNVDALRGIVTQYGALIVVQAAAVFGFIYLTGILGHKIRYDLRKAMFGKLQQLSLGYYNRTPVGWIISRVTSDADRVAELVTWGMLDVTWGVFNIGTALIFMWMISPQLTVIVALIIPIIVVVALEFKKRIIVQYRNVRRINSQITGNYNETITGVRVIKALGREEANLDEFEDLSGEMYAAGYRAAWLSALFLPTVQLLSALAVGAVIWYGGLQAQVGGITIGGIQAFISYITFMLWPIQEVARVYAGMQQAIASGERIYSLLDSEPEVVDKADAYDPRDMRGSIAFDNVDFYYEEGKPVLTGFNLHVKQGETIALVGPTGGGKSTIVNLVARFYEPKRGAILIDGADYTDFTQQAIQSRIGMVLQTPHLFSGSIRENLRYGRLDATDAEIEEAAQLVGAHEFILRLPHGYDEEVGEGGNLLSVGQKQLISLARAVLARPDIFIMDEATSSVDTLTEALIQQGMETLMAGRTSFIIAHRLSTIRNADRILVIEDGRIAEMGNHRDLLALGGHYYRLYTQQFKREAGVDASTGSAREAQHEEMDGQRHAVDGDRGELEHEQKAHRRLVEPEYGD